MINSVSILTGVAQTIRSLDKWNSKDKMDILITDNKKDIYMPTLSIKVDWLSTDNILSNLTFKIVNIFITYINPTVENGLYPQEDNLNTMDELTELFNEYLILKTRKLPIMSKNYLNDNSVFKIQLKFPDDKSSKNERPDYTYDDLMEVINARVLVNDKEIPSFTFSNKNKE